MTPQTTDTDQTRRELIRAGEAGSDALAVALRGVLDALGSLCDATNGHAMDAITARFFAAAPPLGPAMPTGPDSAGEEAIGRMIFGELRCPDAAGSAFLLGRVYCALVDSGTHCADTFLLAAAAVALESLPPRGAPTMRRRGRGFLPSEPAA